MRVMVTGHLGYIGTQLVPMLIQAGHDVAGVDSGLYAGPHTALPCGLFADHRCDIRDIKTSMLAGCDAIVHLAGLSNDPLGDLNPDCTYDINYRATVRLAECARQVGVSRFLFASSCSLYGAAAEQTTPLTESAPFNPVTPYGESKILAERDLLGLADDNFSPTFLRCATVYGDSPMLRADLVVNNLTAYAMFQGEVLLKSDGTSWRPLIHVDDVCRAYLAILEAPRDLTHAEAFNVGRTDENYLIREVAKQVERIVPDCRIRYSPGASSDARCYRVDCRKLERRLPAFDPQWTVERGIAQLMTAYLRRKWTLSDLLGPGYMRIARVKEMLTAGEIDTSLRPRTFLKNAA